MTIKEGNWYRRADGNTVKVRYSDGLYFKAGDHKYLCELQGRYWSGGPSHLDLLSECPDPSLVNGRKPYVRSS
jgi:hypothetical protein